MIKDWINYYLDISKQVSTRSSCIRSKVGCIIVGEDKFIKSTGYNGTPSKVISCKDKGSCHRINNNIKSGTQYETCRSIHAEQNAIIQAGIDKCKNSTIFIYGHYFVCIMCKRFIIQSGIKDIYLKQNDNSDIIHIKTEELIEELNNE